MVKIVVVGFEVYRGILSYLLFINLKAINHRVLKTIFERDSFSDYD